MRTQTQTHTRGRTGEQKASFNYTKLKLQEPKELDKPKMSLKDQKTK